MTQLHDITSLSFLDSDRGYVVVADRTLSNALRSGFTICPSSQNILDWLQNVAALCFRDDKGPIINHAL